MLRKEVQQELESIRLGSGGVLKAEDVVEFAKNPDTALHSAFEWDDTEAAQQWRLAQARGVIRLCVTVISEEAEPVRAFVSLPSDRANGGGYRSTMDVVNDEVRRGEMLADALARLQSIKRKYSHLQALLPVFEALDGVAGSQAVRAAG